ncbi:APC family permease [Magnetovibrio sp.]|uniref:APC family permease n=1 Tax=Magnetovibrio sp. TaxID=2024836 RepID=UPI002F947FA9
MDATQPELKRALGLLSLTLYGLGTIIGAGIYVLVGAVADRSGMSAPLAFLLAGVLAAFTGLSYAELGQRLPEAAGAAAYAREGFKSHWMGRIAGFLTLAVAMVAAASVARGGAGYLLTMIDIPLPIASGGVIVLFTVLACWGVKESVYAAGAMTVIEVGGLLAVIVIGGPALADLGVRLPDIWPADLNGWGGVMGGAFLAFFAFAGFENIVNMAEETQDVGRTLPRAVVLSIIISAVLYMLVILIAVLSVAPDLLAQSDAPLCLVVDCEKSTMAFFAPVALIATLNGVLIEIVLMARVAYGMARRGWLPKLLSDVHAGRRTPLKATLAVGAIVFALTSFVEFQVLAKATSAMLLLVFLVVNLALIRLKQVDPAPHLAFRVPNWAPVAGAFSSILLLGAEVLA